MVPVGHDAPMPETPLPLRRTDRGWFAVILRGADAGCAILLAAMTLLTAYEIGVRYLLGQPTVWVHDVAIFLLLWFAFLGLAPAERAGQHIRIDLFTRRLPGRARRALEVVIRLLLVVFGVVATWSAVEMTAQSIRLGRMSLSLVPVPIWIPQLSLALGMALLTLEFVRGAWREVRGREERR